jgi:hypothetical protein
MNEEEDYGTYPVMLSYGLLALSLALFIGLPLVIARLAGWV